MKYKMPHTNQPRTMTLDTCLLVILFVYVAIGLMIATVATYKKQIQCDDPDGVPFVMAVIVFGWPVIMYKVYHYKKQDKGSDNE